MSRNKHKLYLLTFIYLYLIL